MLQFLDRAGSSNNLIVTNVIARILPGVSLVLSNFIFLFSNSALDIQQCFAVLCADIKLHSLVSYKDYSVPETLVTTGREREAAPVSLSSYVSLEFRIAFP